MEQAAAIYKVRLFSSISIELNGTRVAAPPKALELLCYLLLYRHQFHNREALAEVLWRDAPATLSKKYLRQAFWRLKAVFPPKPRAAATGVEPLLVLDPGSVGINPDASLWLDVDEFERAFGDFRDIPAEALTDAAADRLEYAVQLHRGDLMVTSYQDWCVLERERLQLKRVAMLEKLMCYCQHHGWYAKGLAHGESILRHDPARESTHRGLMRLHYLAGSRTDALRQFERCAAAMAREFDLSPSADTFQLREQIRLDRLDVSRPAGRTDWPADRQVDIETLQDRLDQIQRSLSALHDLVQRTLPGQPPSGSRDSALAANMVWHRYCHRDAAPEVLPNGQR